MSIFNITVSDLVNYLLPPKKRSDNLIALGVGLLSAFKRVHHTFIEYKTGATAINWVAGTYAIYDQVIYERRVYESLEDGNTATPDDSTKWVLLLDSFLGVDMSQQFNCGKLQLEYALNKYFSTTFNQPPTLSDIYITNNVLDVQPFRIGAIEDTSSAMGYLGSSEFIMYDYSIASQPTLFAINIPIADYTALGADAEQIIRNFADKYVACSITYEIITY